MIWALRIFFTIVLLAMLAVTGWAGSLEPIWQIPPQVTGDPWFIATMFDAYFGFLTFYCWVLYKEQGLAPRMIWLILILILGNIAMAIYMLIQLFRLPANASLDQLLLRRKS